MKHRIIVATVLLAGMSGPVVAQPAAAPPRVEIGGHAGVFPGTDFDDIGLLLAFGPRVAVHLIDNLSIELSGDVDSVGRHGVAGFYYVTGRYTFPQSLPGRDRVFVTFGAAGFFEHFTFPGYSYTLPDGTRVTWPSDSVTRLERPTGVVAGVGMDRVVSPHLAVRLSAEGVFFQGPVIGGRFLAGISVPVGRYR